MGSNEPQAASWQTLLGLGAVVAVLLVIGLVLGVLLDRILGTAPVFLLVGIAVGLIAAIVYAVGKFRQYLKS